MATFTKVAQLGDIPADAGRIVEAGGKTLALFRASGTVYAIDNTCVHRGGPLGEGDLRGTVVACPWHGWQYDVTTGQSPLHAEIRVPCYPVRVEGEDVLVEL